MSEFSGKVAIVTGGGRGQGRSHAICLAEAGAAVAICDITEQDPSIPYPTGQAGDLEETLRIIEKNGGSGLARVVDVRSHDAVAEFTREVAAELGTPDILVAQAGNMAPAPIQELEPAMWSSVIDVCLTGIYNAIHTAVPYMIEKEWGRIIATSSGFERTGGMNMSNYCAAKWGVIGLIKSVAKDVGRYNITANALCLGLIDTPIVRNDSLRKLFNPELENPTDADVDRKVQELGMHFLPVAGIDPIEVSNAVLFLASEKAKYISGGTIDVGAGFAANHT
jgi:NAD(P)-dependent dehydrogenase (short-subunit alcohol dehydrogenase family)